MSGLGTRLVDLTLRFRDNSNYATSVAPLFLHLTLTEMYCMYIMTIIIMGSLIRTHCTLGCMMLIRELRWSAVTVLGSANERLMKHAGGSHYFLHLMASYNIIYIYISPLH